MYSTLADIKKSISEETLIQLSDDDNLGVVNEDNVTQAIATADAEIDGYCGVKYAVPFTGTIPAVVGKLSAEIAIYYLYKRRIVSEKIEKQYDKAVARLKDIARGLLSLGVDPAPLASTDASRPKSNKTENDRVFTLDKMRGF